MDIYKDELVIAEQILANTSIACQAELQPMTEQNTPNIVLSSVFEKTPNTDDLYFVKSILVTTNKNKNDDVFLADEVWRAKATPVDKMWNIEHDHKRIVGHITSTWAVDSELNMLADDLTEDKLPPLYHLISAGVIYAKWTDPDLQEQASQLIEEIEEGMWFTSMEARFSNFGFALYKDDDFKIVERNETTAFLTKKLRCYGGDGIHDGYSVGRILRGITFSGNSLVKRPANPDSIILANSEKKIEKIVVSSENNGVYIKCSEENNNMSDVLEKQVAELKDALKAAQAENKGLSDKLASASTEKLESEIAQLKQELADAQENMEQMKKKKKEMEESCSTLTQELENSKAEYAKVKADLDTIRTEATKAARVRQLRDAGLSDEDALSKAESLIGLSNEQFDAVANALSLVKPAVKAEDEQEDDKATKASAELDNANESEDEVDATASDENDIDDLMALVAAHYDEKLKESK